MEFVAQKKITKKTTLAMASKPIGVVQTFLLTGTDLILFQRSDPRKNYGPYTGCVKKGCDLDGFSTVIREGGEETGLKLQIDAISQSSFSIDCFSPHSRKPIKIYPYLCKLPQNILGITDIVLNPDELIRYQLFDKNSALELMQREGEIEAFKGLTMMIKEGLL